MHLFRDICHQKTKLHSKFDFPAVVVVSTSHAGSNSRRGGLSLTQILDVFMQLLLARNEVHWMNISCETRCHIKFKSLSHLGMYITLGHPETPPFLPIWKHIETPGDLRTTITTRRYRGKSTALHPVQCEQQDKCTSPKHKQFTGARVLFG